jgi:DNA modification methylase
MTVKILTGDCRDVLKTLPDQSVHCVVTSPPYFGLRSYFPDVVRLRPDLPDDVRARVLSELAALNVSPIYHTSE